MSTLISMQLTPQQARQDIEPMVDTAPKYPWGLQINLREEQLDKLGISALPEVGKEIQLFAKAEVVSVSVEETQGSDGPRKCLDLQITDLQLAGVEQDVFGRATDVLYGKDQRK